MVTALVVLSEAAVEVLGSLGAISLARKYQRVLRRGGRKALFLAGRLRAELLDELDCLERRQRVLYGHDWRSRALGADPLGHLHADMMTALRARVEEAYDGLEDLRKDEIEARCRALTRIAEELSVLVVGLERREAGHRLGAEAQAVVQDDNGGRWPSPDAAWATSGSCPLPQRA